MRYLQWRKNAKTVNVVINNVIVMHVIFQVGVLSFNQILINFADRNGITKIFLVSRSMYMFFLISILPTTLRESVFVSFYIDM